MGSAAVIMLIAAAFVIGMFWNKLQNLEKQVAILMSNNNNTIQVGNQAGTANNQAGTVNQAAANPPAVNAAPQLGSAGDVDKLKEEDHVRGERNARILLIEYSDLECPFCKRFHPTAQQVVDTYDGQVAWVYRHFPLVQLHSKAPKEAEATECANELGGNEAFWKYTDKLFEVTPANNGLDPAELPKIAALVGLNESKFKTCLDSGKYAQRVQDDLASGTKAGVTGTPGNIILDTKTGKTKLLPGAYPFDQVKQAIDELLKET